MTDIRNARSDEPHRPRAVLFDINGTLVDSNYLHIEAWHEAFATVGHPVPYWRIHRAIGLDSTKLVKSLLGKHAESLGDQVRRLHSEAYLAEAGRLRAFDGARELIRTLARADVRIVLATSAPNEELVVLRRVLYGDSLLHAVTSADDVKQAKPEPDVVQLALQRAQVDVRDAILVGDSVWDMEAASRAGLTAVGVLSGGTGSEALRRAGAIAIYEDAADLLARLDDSPLARLLREVKPRRVFPR